MFIQLLSHPQLRLVVVDKLHHGTVCMISMTCRELLRLYNEPLKVQLKPCKQMDGECIGRVSMIQYINISIDDKLADTLAAAGCISALSYCFEKGATISANLMSYAARNGQLETLKYLYDNECRSPKTDNYVIKYH